MQKQREATMAQQRVRARARCRLPGQAMAIRKVVGKGERHTGKKFPAVRCCFCYSSATLACRLFGMHTPPENYHAEHHRAGKELFITQ